LATAWSTSRSLQGGEWIQVDLGKAARVGRIELLLGREPAGHEPEIAVLTSEDGLEFQEAPSVSARPAIASQAASGWPLSQELLIKPRPVQGVRIVQRGRRPDSWSVAELRVWARRPPTRERGEFP